VRQAGEHKLEIEPVLSTTLSCRMLPPASVVINATGMGKVLPGSPITDAGNFPINGVAWELNYRGELQFMHQALAQREKRNLTVEDGWVYFLHGWTQVIARALHIQLDEATFNRLAVIAKVIRPRCRRGSYRRIADKRRPGVPYERSD
jgi:shikimate dehydrogenase